MTDTTSHTEVLLRRIAAETLLRDLMPVLVNNGWAVGVDDSHGCRSLTASKGTGRLYLPGGRSGKWNAQVIQVASADSTPAGLRDLLPDYDERPVWRVELEQSAPAGLVLTVAEAADDGTAGVLAAR